MISKTYRCSFSKTCKIFGIFLLNSLAATGILGAPTVFSAEKRQVIVNPGDTADLYKKLNQAETAGHVLLLSGIYVLDAQLGDAAGAATQGGYLHLGDRHLSGTNVFTDADGDGVPDSIGVDQVTGKAIYVDPQAETVIDGSNITLDPVEDRIVVEGPDGYASLPYNRPLIWAAEGNTIKDVTVRWAHPSPDDPVGLTLGTIHLRGGTKGMVSGCTIEDGDMGINIANIGKESAGTMLKGAAIGNVLRNHARHGLGVFVFGNEDARALAKLEENRSVENGGGGLAFGNLSCHRCTVDVTSTGNAYQGNTFGIFTPGAGVGIGTTQSPTSENKTRLTSIHDSFENNFFGVFAFGALRFDDASHTADDNTTSLHFLDTRFSGNVDTTFLASDVSDPSAGSGNSLRILIRQADFESGGPFVGVRATPEENKLVFLGNAVSWESTNQDTPIPAPPPGDSYDLFSGGKP